MKNYFDEKARINNYIYIYIVSYRVFSNRIRTIYELEYLNYGGIGGPAQ